MIQGLGGGSLAGPILLVGYVVFFFEGGRNSILFARAYCLSAKRMAAEVPVRPVRSWISRMTARSSTVRRIECCLPSSIGMQCKPLHPTAATQIDSLAGQTTRRWETGPQAS